MLAIHTGLAVSSSLRESPTVDEVLHLPAGVSYWQTGRFKLYHHNPPLPRMVAALPVLVAGVETDGLYRQPYWLMDRPNKTWFGHDFMRLNASRWFELFAGARLVMLFFSLLGGLAVFLWSRRLYGDWAGLLSLTLWSFCPNILAHGRLITTDVPAASMMIVSTFAFWSYLKKPGWKLAATTGLLLGLAQLTKYTCLLLFGIWPLLWLLEATRGGVGRVLSRSAGIRLVRGLLIASVCVLVINLGYGFEGTGMRLGSFPFVSQTLTRDRATLLPGPIEPFDLYRELHAVRVNRFQGTPLESLPIPFPREYVLGFDDQKFEAEGVPARAFDRSAPPDRLSGYPVYLNGQLRNESWWYYYFLALAYKIPEGTWALWIGAVFLTVLCKKYRNEWRDELAVLAVPLVVLFVMSIFTNINLGLRYVLPSFPFLFVFAGKIAPWAGSLDGAWRRSMVGLITLALGATVTATLSIHPHYLAYFNSLAGGPSRGSEHLIDSNLDWGQDLIGLKEWIDREAPGERIGIAYFGQIPPTIFEARGEPIDWFLPPALPGSWKGPPPPRYRTIESNGPPPPGLYAISASLLRGLPWRVYDAPTPGYPAARAWAPHDANRGAYSYFQRFRPVDHIGHSILIYRLTPMDSARLAPLWPSG